MTSYLILIALVWAVIGLLIAFVMRRRGHDFFVWLVLGVPLGPLVVPLAIERVRFHEAAEHQSRGAPTPPHAGFDLVAGVDGSQEAVDAIETAIALFGGMLSSVTLATVVDFDAIESFTGQDTQTAARDLLDRVAASVSYEPVDKIVLFGRPDVALAEFARTSGTELIVVGARGHGATEALFGSITAKLVGQSEIPVFVGPSTASPAESGVSSGGLAGAV